MIMNFSFHWRNPRHWDVYDDKRRIFRIRGRGSEGLDSDGTFCVMDERARGKSFVTDGFKTLSSAVAFITDELMHYEGTNQ